MRTNRSEIDVAAAHSVIIYLITQTPQLTEAIAAVEGFVSVAVDFQHSMIYLSDYAAYLRCFSFVSFHKCCSFFHASLKGEKRFMNLFKYQVSPVTWTWSNCMLL